MDKANPSHLVFDTKNRNHVNPTFPLKFFSFLTQKKKKRIQYIWKQFKRTDHTFHHLTGDTIIVCTIANMAPYIFHGREELPEIEIERFCI